MLSLCFICGIIIKNKWEVLLCHKLSQSNHLITKNIAYNQELDFYIATDYDIYLLCLINSHEECEIIYPVKDDGVIYIVGKLPFDKDTIIDSIDKILNSLREVYGFPKIKNPNCSVKFQIF